MNDNELTYKVKDLETRQDKIERKQDNIDSIVSDIRSGITSIRESLLSNTEQGDLKNQLLMKDIEGIKDRVKKLETNQRWLVTSIVGEVLAIIFGVIMIFIQKGI